MYRSSSCLVRSRRDIGIALSRVRRDRNEVHFCFLCSFCQDAFKFLQTLQQMVQSHLGGTLNEPRLNQSCPISSDARTPFRSSWNTLGMLALCLVPRPTIAREGSHLSGEDIHGKSHQHGKPHPDGEPAGSWVPGSVRDLKSSNALLSLPRLRHNRTLKTGQ